MKHVAIIWKCSLLFRQKLKASSLIEINVGIVIIGIIFSLSMMIYVNITASSLQANQIKYKNELKILAQKIITDKSYFEDEFIQNDYLIRQKVEPYQDNLNCLLIHLQAFVYGRPVAEYKILHYEPAN